MQLCVNTVKKVHYFNWERMVMVGKSEVRIRIIAHIVMILLSIFAVLPFVLLISASLTEEKAALNYGFNFIPKVFSMDAYVYIMRQRNMIFRAYAITIFTTVIGTGAGLVITALLGYGLTKDIPGKRFFDFQSFLDKVFQPNFIPGNFLIRKTTLIEIIRQFCQREKEFPFFIGKGYFIIICIA